MPSLTVPFPASLPYSGLICNCSPNVAFEEKDDAEDVVDDEEDDVICSNNGNCK